MPIRWNSPILKCGAVVLVCAAIVALVGGPGRLAEVSPELWVVLVCGPAGYCLFHAALVLIETIDAARREGGDAPR